MLALPYSRTGADMDPNPRAALERQQLRLRERQKFFEDILQPETEFVFPLSHLHLESQRRKFQFLRNGIGLGWERCPCGSQILGTSSLPVFEAQFGVLHVHVTISQL